MHDAKNLKLMGFDVDGVLSDGRLYYAEDGSEIKAFHTLDGQGLKMLRDAGIAVAIITGRRSGAVAARAANLGIDLLYQGIEDKRGTMAEILAARGLSFAEAGYMGDDIVDLPLMRACGYSVAPANAHGLVKQHSSLVTTGSGGAGAVREACEAILQAQGKLQAVLAAYLA
jgi:3-deoxy-D-manno-octulosonate 8-phosphate phosphatase (KDO 8-P phosphatase)